MSSSSNRASTSTSSSTSVRNLNVQDVEGITVADVGGAVQIVTTDHGTVAAAERIAGSSLTGAIDLVRDAQTGVFQLADNFGAGASNLVRDLFGASIGVVRESQAQLGNTVSALNQIAREQSTSSDERVQTIARYSLIAGAAVVALIVAAQIFRK